MNLSGEPRYYVDVDQEPGKPNPTAHRRPRPPGSVPTIIGLSTHKQGDYLFLLGRAYRRWHGHEDDLWFAGTRTAMRPAAHDALY